MTRAGIREARQNLSALLDEVRKGREVLITDRGRPVARLVPPRPESAGPFPDLAERRSCLPRLTPPLSATVAEEREDRL